MINIKLVLISTLFPISFWYVAFASAEEECYGPRTPDEIAHVLWENTSNYTYMKRTRPNLARLIAEDPKANPSRSEPDIVRLQMIIISVKGLNQQRGEVELMVNLKHRWNDYRLEYASVDSCYSEKDREGFEMDDISNIWTPYFAIGNAVSPPNNIASSFWIYPNGDVLVEKNILLTVGCKLDFRYFPRDTQACKVIIETWKDDASTVLFDFLKPAIRFRSTTGDSQFSLGHSLEWKLGDLNATTFVFAKTGMAKPKSYAIFHMELKRQSVYYLQFVVIPVIFMVSIGYASFFIDRGSAPARVSMSTIGFLTISNFLSSELKSLPRLGNGEAWLLLFMQLSMIFTFYSVIEYVFCNYLYRVESRLKNVRKLAIEVKQERRISDHSYAIAQINNGIEITKKEMIAIGVSKIDRILLKEDGNMLFRDEHIDIFSRYAYPIVYAIVCFACFLRL